MTPIIEPDRDKRARALAAKGAVRRAADHFQVTPPSLLEEPPSFKVWRDRRGRVCCTCPDYVARQNPWFRCEQILAVKHFLTALPVAVYREPDGLLLASCQTTRPDQASEYATAKRAIKINLVHAASSAATLLGVAPSRSATFMLGMPEVLLETLENCGDAEAARHAAIAYLNRHPTQANNGQ